MEEDTESKSRVRVLPPHPEVGKFLEEHPEPNWEELLLFLADTFPQSEDNLQYLIEGGAAVHLLQPERQTPDDVDFIFKDTEDGKKFSRLPGKSANEWLYSKGLPESDGNVDYLFHQFVPHEFKGRTLYLLNPPGLAFSKSVNYYHQPPREKDKADVQILGVMGEQISSFREGFKR